MNLNIKKINPLGIECHEFRKNIITRDLKSEEKYLHENIDYKLVPNEDLWKFSKKKWDSMDFLDLYGCFYNDILIGISGTKIYGNYLRTGMMYYILKDFRKSFRSLLWIENGFLSNVDKSQFRGYFVSIYPHNNKLKSWCYYLNNNKNLGQLSKNASELIELNKLKFYNDYVMLSKCPQKLLYSITDNDLNTFLEEISDK